MPQVHPIPSLIDRRNLQVDVHPKYEVTMQTQNHAKCFGFRLCHCWPFSSKVMLSGLARCVRPNPPTTNSMVQFLSLMGVFHRGVYC